MHVEGRTETDRLLKKERERDTKETVATFGVTEQSAPRFMTCDATVTAGGQFASNDSGANVHLILRQFNIRADGKLT